MDDRTQDRQRALISAIGSGDVDALSELYDMFERPVFAVALRTINDKHRAEEVVQDTFLKVWRNAARYDPDRGAAGAWIFTIAKRTAIDLRLHEQRRSVDALFDSDEPSTPDTSDETWLAWQINLALAQLPQEQREVIDLFMLSGYTHAEISERLDTPLGTVKTRIYTGLRRLRRSLADQGVEG